MKLIDENLIDIVPKSEQNGAGPKGWGWLVPDQLVLVNIEKAANIHDCHYHIIKRFYPITSPVLFLKESNPEFWQALESKKTAIKYANETFLKNLNSINKENSPTKLGYYARKPIIYTYYLAVKYFGKRFVK